MAEEQKQQELETKPDHYGLIAKDLIAILGSGEDFDKIEGIIRDRLEQAHANGMESASNNPLDLQGRQVSALEAIADHLGAFRKAKIDERADVGKMREVLQECRQILRHPRMVANNDLIRRIDEVAR